MHVRSLRLSLVAIATVVGGACACKSTANTAGTKALAEAPPAPGAGAVERTHLEVRRFRNLFHKIASAQGMSDDDIKKMVLLPNDAFFTPPSAALTAVNAQTANDALLAQAKSPSETVAAYYQNSQTEPFDSSIDVDQIYAKNGPATLIIIPGIFGEFIDKYAMHELFGSPSAFAAAYQDKLQLVQDQGYSLSALGPVNFNLGERVHLGGIDGKDQRPHVQALFMQAAFGSLESLGDNAANATIFLNRLNKVFSQIPLDSCRNIYLVGYSQGTDVVLDMMAQAYGAPGQYPFLKNVKGILTMAGVIYGTEAAEDAYFNESSANYRLTKQIKATLDSLEVPASGDQFQTSAGKLLKDWQEIIAAAVQLAQVPQPTLDPGLNRESLNTAVSDPAQMLDQISHVFTDLFRPGLTAAERLSNIQRGKILIDAVLRGTRGLATHARMDWWASHQLPASLPVYSVAASMPDASTESSSSPLLASAYYGADTVDYQKTLRPGYYSLRQVTGAQINDSQVLTQKELILPALIAKWNPQQAEFPTHFLGILGTHHWGIAFPNVADTAGGATNPFPRRVYAEAVGAFLLAPQG